jgi:hypothetical protein
MHQRQRIGGDDESQEHPPPGTGPWAGAGVRFGGTRLLRRAHAGPGQVDLFRHPAKTLIYLDSRGGTWALRRKGEAMLRQAVTIPCPQCGQGATIMLHATSVSQSCGATSLIGLTCSNAEPHAQLTHAELVSLWEALGTNWRTNGQHLG